MTVAAGAAPGGTCGTPITVPAGTAVITETIPAGTLLTGVSTLPSAGTAGQQQSGRRHGHRDGECRRADNRHLHRRSHTRGPDHWLSYRFAKWPVPALPWDVTSPSTWLEHRVTVAAGAAPAAPAGRPLRCQPATRWSPKQFRAVIVLTGVSTLPSAGLLVSSNLAAGTATVTVTCGRADDCHIHRRGHTGRPDHRLRSSLQSSGCRRRSGYELQFQRGGNSGDSCGRRWRRAAPAVRQLSVPAGTAVVTETIPAGVLVTGVSTLPSAGIAGQQQSRGGHGYCNGDCRAGRPS